MLVHSWIPVKLAECFFRTQSLPYLDNKVPWNLQFKGISLKWTYSGYKILLSAFPPSSIVHNNLSRKGRRALIQHPNGIIMITMVWRIYLQVICT